MDHQARGPHDKWHAQVPGGPRDIVTELFYRTSEGAANAKNPNMQPGKQWTWMHEDMCTMLKSASPWKVRNNSNVNMPDTRVKGIAHNGDFTTVLHPANCVGKKA